eukprot:7677277-Pyramimonas_sp.AAC.1
MEQEEDEHAICEFAFAAMSAVAPAQRAAEEAGVGDHPRALPHPSMHRCIRSTGLPRKARSLVLGLSTSPPCSPFAQMNKSSDARMKNSLRNPFAPISVVGLVLVAIPQELNDRRPLM